MQQGLLVEFSCEISTRYPPKRFTHLWHYCSLRLVVATILYELYISEELLSIIREQDKLTRR